MKRAIERVFAAGTICLTHLAAGGAKGNLGMSGNP